MKNTSLSLKTLSPLYLFILAAWTVYRYITHFPASIDELLVKPIIWLTPVLIVMLGKKIKLSTLNFYTPTLKIILISVASGVLLSLLQLVPNFYNGQTQLKVILGIRPLLSLMLPFMGTAISEETLFRGFFMQQIRRKYSSFTSVGLTSLFFTIIHLPILIFINHIYGLNLLIGLYTIFASGVGFGILFIYSKTIWSPIIAHFILDVLLTIF